MSSVLVEPPANASQLYFVFDRSEFSVGQEHGERDSREDAGQGKVGDSTVFGCRPKTISDNDEVSFPSERTINRSGGRPSVDLASESSPILLRTSEGRTRMDGPVRIGTVMIRLLKRYGISDEEIAEGMASYVRQQQTGMAS